MEIEYKNIHMNRVSYRNSYRVTVSEDVNVPDNKPDIMQIVWHTGGVRVNEKRVMNGKLYVSFAVPYAVLYLSEAAEYELQCVRGEVALEEVLDLGTDSVVADLASVDINIRAETEEMDATMIHSRKLSLRVVLGLMVVAEDVDDLRAAVGITRDRPIHTKTENLHLSALVGDKRDALRIREELFLPSGKDSVAELIYFEMMLREVETRAKDGLFELKGELSMFLFFRNDRGATDFYEGNVPFRSEIMISGCEEGLTPDATFRLTKESLTVKTDEDGEDRLLEIEGILETEVKLYRETELWILSDAYATDCVLSPVRETVEYENLLMRNDSRKRMTERIRVPEEMPEMLQLCRGKVEILPDVCERDGETLNLSGFLNVGVLYVTKEDERSYQSFQTRLPFSHTIEVRGLTPQSTYDIHCNITDAVFSMTRNGEVEMKAELSFVVVAMEQCTWQVIQDVVTTEFEEHALEERESMIGHPVVRGETLWDIAKTYCVDEEKIISLVDRQGEPQEGDVLLIVKSVN